MIDVILSWSEVLIAGNVAVQRIVAAKKNQWMNKHTTSNDSEGDLNHLIGCRGEMAVAKHYNLYWPPAGGQLDVVDVGAAISVRTRTKIGDDLAILPDDNPTLPYVLVIDQCPIMRLVGWFNGGDGKREEWFLKKFRPGSDGIYFVPQRVLLPIDQLVPQRRGC